VEAIYEGFIITTPTGKVIQSLVIVDPESNIPGLIVLPTVISGIQNVGLEGESGRHVIFEVRSYTIETLSRPQVTVTQHSPNVQQTHQGKL